LPSAPASENDEIGNDEKNKDVSMDLEPATPPRKANPGIILKFIVLN